jgi:NADH-dependent peroxiredoxin subunit F
MKNMQEKIYDLIIIGGGPAGAAAAVYAGRKLLNTLVITEEFGGQSVVSDDIHNWVGTISISGRKLAEDLEKHVLAYKGEYLEILKNKVVNIEKIESPVLNFKVKTNTGKTFLSKTVLITTGSKRRQLDALGAKEYEHKGLTYCASCDGLFFANKDVVVVGAGNSALESALQLLAYCKSVKILVRSENIRGDEITLESILKNKNAEIIYNSETVEVGGDKTVKFLKYKNIISGEIKTLDVEGVFIEIGQIPNTDIFKNLIKIDAFGKVEIDLRNNQTSQKGIWAAGDCTNILYHQNNIAAGEGVKALEDIYQYVKKIF